MAVVPASSLMKRTKKSFIGKCPVVTKVILNGCRARFFRKQTGEKLFYLMYSAGLGNHAENADIELDKGAVQKRKRGSKPDGQTEDGQAIFKADRTRLVGNKTAIKLFIAGPP
jgi:hypothetical protein